MTQFISGIGGRILCERHKWPSGESVGGFHKLTAADVSYLEAELATDNICETCRGADAKEIDVECDDGECEQTATNTFEGYNWCEAHRWEVAK